MVLVDDRPTLSGFIVHGHGGRRLSSALGSSPGQRAGWRIESIRSSDRTDRTANFGGSMLPLTKFLTEELVLIEQGIRFSLSVRRLSLSPELSRPSYQVPRLSVSFIYGVNRNRS